MSTLIKYRMFYLMVVSAIIISLYDIYVTVLTIETIFKDELNTIVKALIEYCCSNTFELLSIQVVYKNGVAALILIKTFLLCAISSGSTVFYYSKLILLKKILFSLVVIYFIEHVFVLGVLLW